MERKDEAMERVQEDVKYIIYFSPVLTRGPSLPFLCFYKSFWTWQRRGFSILYVYFNLVKQYIAMTPLELQGFWHRTKETEMSPFYFKVQEVPE